MRKNEAIMMSQNNEEDTKITTAQAFVQSSQSWGAKRGRAWGAGGGRSGSIVLEKGWAGRALGHVFMRNKADLTTGG